MADKPDLTVAEGLFEVIAYRVRRDGKPYVGGTSLRESADKSAVVCETCGPLPADGLPGWISDWITLCGAARGHVLEAGHRVAVESWRGAVYGPEEEGLMTIKSATDAAERAAENGHLFTGDEGESPCALDAAPARLPGAPTLTATGRARSLSCPASRR